MVEHVGYAPTRSILQGSSGTMPVFPMVPSPGLSPGSSTLEASRSVFELRGREVDACQRLPRGKIDFADRRFGSLPGERFKWCGVSKLHRVGVLLNRFTGGPRSTTGLPPQKWSQRIHSAKWG
jgi:hypothetical protein